MIEADQTLGCVDDLRICCAHMHHALSYSYDAAHTGS